MVKRRDGSVVEHPSFVLLARDPIAVVALRAYAAEAERRMLAGDKEITPEWIADIRAFADLWDKYRAEHGDGDPGCGPHRKDDPATLEEMRKGWSA